MNLISKFKIIQLKTEGNLMKYCNFNKTFKNLKKNMKKFNKNTMKMIIKSIIFNQHKIIQIYSQTNLNNIN